MEEAGISTLKSSTPKDWRGVKTVNIGFPLMLRPSFILGGGGTSVVNNENELQKLSDACCFSNTGSAYRGISLWMGRVWTRSNERLRNRCVCGIENFDSMGIHTGDSITVAPIQTLSIKSIKQWEMKH